MNTHIQGSGRNSEVIKPQSLFGLYILAKKAEY